jgi:hypothetical protein
MTSIEKNAFSGGESPGKTSIADLPEQATNSNSKGESANFTPEY